MSIAAMLHSVHLLRGHLGPSFVELQTPRGTRSPRGAFVNLVVGSLPHVRYFAMQARFANTTIANFPRLQRPSTNGRLSKADILKYLDVADEVVMYLEFGEPEFLGPAEPGPLAIINQVLADGRASRARLATATNEWPFTLAEEASFLRSFGMIVEPNHPLTEVSEGAAKFLLLGVAETCRSLARSRRFRE